MKLRIGERNSKRNLPRLNKRLESQESIWQSCDWGVRLRTLSLALRSPLHQDLSYMLLEGEDYWIEGIEWQWRQRVILWDSGTSRREEGAGILPRNSTLDVKEYDRDGRGTSGNKRSVTTEESKLWTGENGAMGEDMGDTEIVSRRRWKAFLRYWRRNMRGRRRRLLYCGSRILRVSKDNSEFLFKCVRACVRACVRVQ